MSKPSAPDRIWLQPVEEDYRGWTWCWHAIDEGDDPDIEYIRAEAAAEMMAQKLEDAPNPGSDEWSEEYVAGWLNAARYLRGEAP